MAADSIPLCRLCGSPVRVMSHLAPPTLKGQGSGGPSERVCTNPDCTSNTGPKVLKGV